MTGNFGYKNVHQDNKVSVCAIVLRGHKGYLPRKRAPFVLF